jgi:hypothetical protein
VLPESFPQFSQNLFGFLPLSRGRFGAELPHPLVNRGQFHDLTIVFMAAADNTDFSVTAKNLTEDHWQMSD